ncbi:MAG: N-acetylmuramoyl-L-alanine amidase [Deltaproteobacteria bacterium]|nr:N-acetylmuramoyl-L-alanine amidase [Deltaproteobacteria bacterium]
MTRARTSAPSRVRRPALALAAVLLLAPAADAAPGRVLDVRHWSYAGYTRVVVELSQPASSGAASAGAPGMALRQAPADPATGAPARLYLDLPGIHVGRTREEPIRVDDGLLRRIRLGQFTVGTTRVVLDLDHWERHRLLRLTGPERVVIDVFGARQGAPAASSTARPSMELRPVERVVVDAGHGGSDPGAIGHGRLREKDVTLRLARALRRELLARGFDVVLTRDGDRTLSLLERTALAEGAEADVFVSLHANSARNRAAAGIEVYTLDENALRQTRRLAARENGVAPGEVDALQGLLTRLRVSEASDRADLLADLVHEEIVRGMGRRWPSVAAGRGRLRGPFYVLYLSDMPAILVETGFVTHKGDARRLRDPDYLDAMARRIARGIERFREQSGPLVAEHQP